MEGSEEFFIGMEKRDDTLGPRRVYLNSPSDLDTNVFTTGCSALNSATFCCIYCIRVHSVVGIVFEYILSVGIVPWCFECR